MKGFRAAYTVLLTYRKQGVGRRLCESRGDVSRDHQRPVSYFYFIRFKTTQNFVVSVLSCGDVSAGKPLHDCNMMTKTTQERFGSINFH